MWKVNYTKAVINWTETLDNKAKTKILSRIYLLREFGPNLGRPYADTIKGSIYKNLKELRVKSGKNELRLFFIIGKNKEIVILNGGNKTNGKTFYKKMIKRTEKIYSEYLEVEEE